MFKDKIWYIQCTQAFDRFEKGNVYKIVKKNECDWEVQVDNHTSTAVEHKIIRKNFVPVC